MAPAWEELSIKYNKNDDEEVVIGKVDCTTATALCSDQDVTGYPTLKFFKSGADSGVKYREQRDLKSLDKFIKKQMGTAEEEEDVSIFIRYVTLESSFLFPISSYVLFRVYHVYFPLFCITYRKTVILLIGINFSFLKMNREFAIKFLKRVVVCTMLCAISKYMYPVILVTILK